jgi:hypothetical protein
MASDTKMVEKNPPVNAAPAGSACAPLGETIIQGKAVVKV